MWHSWRLLPPFPPAVHRALIALSHSAGAYWPAAGCVTLDWNLGLDCLLTWRWQCLLVAPRNQYGDKVLLLGGNIDGLWKSKCQSSNPNFAIFQLSSLESGQLTPLSFCFLMCIQKYNYYIGFFIIYCISTVLQRTCHISGPSKWKVCCWLMGIVKLEKFSHFI